MGCEWLVLAPTGAPDGTGAEEAAVAESRMGPAEFELEVAASVGSLSDRTGRSVAAETTRSAPPDTVALYGIWETAVTNAREYENPYDFREIELRARVKSPGGEVDTIFGFHDGDGRGGAAGDVWRLRHMPDETGRWTYRYWWTDGTPGDSGSFRVERRGVAPPLRVDEGAPRFFKTARGEPVDFRGYDFHVAAPYLPSRSLEEQVPRIKRWLDWMAGRDYNVTMLGGAINRHLEAPNTWEESWWQSGTTVRFEPATWRAYERVLRAARSRDIYVMTFAGMVFQGEEYGFRNFRVFLRYWVARFGSFSNFFGYSPTWEWRDIWSAEEVDRVMGYVSEILPYRRLLTAHDCSVPMFDDWLVFSMRQEQSRTLFDGNFRSNWNGCPGVAPRFAERPIIGSEDIWETFSGATGQPRTPTEIRRAAWGEMMAGVLPLYSEWHPNPPPAGGEGKAEDEVRRMFDFWYEETGYRNYQTLNGLVSRKRRQAASGIPGEEYLVYDEDGGRIRLDLTAVDGTRRFDVLWFDATSGERQQGAPARGGRRLQRLAPFGDDTVLLLRRQAR